MIESPDYTVLVQRSPAFQGRLPGIITTKYDEVMLAAVMAVARDPEEVRVFVVEGQPLPKARHRAGRNKRGKTRVFNTQKQRRNQELLSWRLRSEFSQPLQGRVVLGCVYYRSTKRKVDIDRLENQTLDAAKGILFDDDRQVMGCVTFMELGVKNPRTVFAVAPMA